jgi:MFS transporter, FSR family, fosmidomycin resistance protein
MNFRLLNYAFAVAVATVFGGHIGDRIGRKQVIWISILGVTPFALILPHAPLALTRPLTFFIGIIISSAAPSILVFAQELLPGKVGAVAGACTQIRINS